MFLPKTSQNVIMLRTPNTKTPTKKCNNPITAHCNAAACQCADALNFYTFVNQLTTKSSDVKSGSVQNSLKSLVLFEMMTSQPPSTAH